MRSRRNGLSLAIGAALLAAACNTPAMAGPQDADQGGANIVLGGARPPRAEADDLAAYNAAFAAYQRGSYAALGPHLARLRRALDRAPATYPAIEQLGPGHWTVRADDMSAAIGLSALAAAAAESAKPGQRATVDTGPNVYPDIALLLGSEAVERRAYDEAIAYLDRGLALQPGHFALAAEKMGAIQGQGRFADALAVGDAALEAGGTSGLFGTSSGIQHRRRGFSLVELGRLDEAQAAYERSLEVDPESTVAKGELDYIARLRAGAAPTEAIPNTQPSAPVAPAAPSAPAAAI